MHKSLVDIKQAIYKFLAKLFKRTPKKLCIAQSFSIAPNYTKAVEYKSVLTEQTKFVESARKNQQEQQIKQRQGKLRRQFSKQDLRDLQHQERLTNKLQAVVDQNSPFAEVGIPIPHTGRVSNGAIEYSQSLLPPTVAGIVIPENAQQSVNEANINGMSQGVRLQFGKLKRQKLRDWANGNYNVIEELVADWTQAVNSRRQYVSLSDEIRRFYMVDRILEIIVSDVLNPDLDGKIVNLSSEDPDKNACLEELQERWDLDVLLESIGIDAVNFGEYSVKIETEPGNGVIGIDEGSVNQIGICAFYDQGYPSNFMVMMQNEVDFDIVPPDSYAHFSMGNGKLRIKLEEHFFGNGHTAVQFDRKNIDDELKLKLPEFIRIGKPFFWAVVDKLRILQILEQLIPAMKIAQITMSKLVSVKVPTTMSYDDVSEILEEYEELLNVQTAIDTTQQQVTLAEILTAAGHIKLIPQFMDGKGALDSLNVREDQSVDDILRAQNDIRQSILSSIGIPFGAVYGPANGVAGTNTDGNRATELRQNSMYTRKLAMVQRSFANFLRQIGMIHLANSGFDHVTPKDVQVRFVNTLVDVAKLEAREMEDAHLYYVKQKLDLLVGALGQDYVTQLLSDNMIKENLLDWLAESFDEITNGVHLFETTEERNGAPERGKLKDAFITNVKDNLMDSINQRLSGLDPFSNAPNGPVGSEFAVHAAQKLGMNDAVDVLQQGAKHPQHDPTIQHVIDTFAQAIRTKLEQRAKTEDLTDDSARNAVRQQVISAVTNAFVDRISR